MVTKYKNLARSIFKSQDVPVELPITGTIPDWVVGTFFRNGPGRFRFGDKLYNHLFDGMACVNKFQISNGKVYFTNKLLESKSYRKALTSKHLPPMFGTPDLCSTMFERFKIFYKPRNDVEGIDNCNVNIVPFGNNQLYALTESNMITRVNPKDLSIMNVKNLKKHLTTTNTSVAHPHVDADDGSWYSVGMQIGKDTSYNFMKFDAKNNTQVDNAVESLKLLARVKTSHSDGLSYFHSFGLTKNYIIFLEQPYVINYKKMLMNFILNKPFSKGVGMKNGVPTYVHVINRHTGEILQNKYHTDPQFTFHHINAYETQDGKQILCDISSYDWSNFKFDDFNYDENIPNQVEQFFTQSKAYAKRVVIPLNEKNTEKSVYCETRVVNSKTTFELPTINYNRFNGLPYQYTYGLGSTLHPFTIVKVNMNKKDEHLYFDLNSDKNKYLTPSEPVFVESPNATHEDDGVLLSLILGDTSDFLLVLDAKTLKEIGRATLPEDVKATFSFHGFFADKQTYQGLN
jgi:beta,beta-carotene 9',10'-dioxygenase